jgi:hypothetical protein
VDTAFQTQKLLYFSHKSDVSHHLFSMYTLSNSVIFLSKRMLNIDKIWCTFCSALRASAELEVTVKI